MHLDKGSRLGPYQIVAPLGAGGMGEGYRALDTRLGREVAIKVLPEDLSDDPKLRLRFEREAKAISSLNHPNICALHDVGESKLGDRNVQYLVMEYLEGKTLDQYLKRGPLTIDQVVRYGIEIAAALDKAHRKQTLHRDLKPANIMITKTGARLFDFGLAKSLRSAERELAVGSSPDEVTSQYLSEGTTPEKSLTAEGAVM